MLYTVEMKRKATNDAPRRTALDLAWGRGQRPRPGPRPSLKLEEIVAAAVALADADGLDALSMQRVAQRVGVTTMALYRYVGGKDDLVFLAVDAAAAKRPPNRRPGEPWRSAVERWARADLELLAAHPWIVRVPLNEPPLGPNQLRWLEHLLMCLEGAGLPAPEQLGVATLLAGYISGYFRQNDDLTRGARSRGMTREEAERAYFEVAVQVVDPERLPNVAAVFAAAGSELLAMSSPETDFEFGLGRILDGVEAMVRRPGA
jgi:AcrR family transcriptional regulator